jgi:hypothetical protein
MDYNADVEVADHGQRVRRIALKSFDTSYSLLQTFRLACKAVWGSVSLSRATDKYALLITTHATHHSESIWDFDQKDILRPGLVDLQKERARSYVLLLTFTYFMCFIACLCEFCRFVPGQQSDAISDRSQLESRANLILTLHDPLPQQCIFPREDTGLAGYRHCLSSP